MNPLLLLALGLAITGGGYGLWTAERNPARIPGVRWSGEELQVRAQAEALLNTHRDVRAIAQSGSQPGDFGFVAGCWTGNSSRGSCSGTQRQPGGQDSALGRAQAPPGAAVLGPDVKSWVQVCRDPANPARIISALSIVTVD